MFAKKTEDGPDYLLSTALRVTVLSLVQMKGQFLRKNCHIDSLEAVDLYPDWTVPNLLLDKGTKLVE